MLETRLEVDSTTVHPSEVELRNWASGERGRIGDSCDVESPSRINIRRVRSNTLDSNFSACSTTDILPKSTPREPLSPRTGRRPFSSPARDACINYDSVPLRDADGLSLLAGSVGPALDPRRWRCSRAGAALLPCSLSALSVPPRRWRRRGCISRAHSHLLAGFRLWLVLVCAAWMTPHVARAHGATAMHARTHIHTHTHTCIHTHTHVCMCMCVYACHQPPHAHTMDTLLCKNDTYTHTHTHTHTPCVCVCVTYHPRAQDLHSCVQKCVRGLKIYARATCGASGRRATSSASPAT